EEHGQPGNPWPCSSLSCRQVFPFLQLSSLPSLGSIPEGESLASGAFGTGTALRRPSVRSVMQQKEGCFSPAGGPVSLPPPRSCSSKRPPERQGHPDQRLGCPFSFREASHRTSL